MKFYELTYLINPDLSEEELRSISEKIINLLKEKGGVIHHSNNTIKKVLGYPIKDKNTAYLVSIDFSLEPEKTDGLKQKISKEKEILRFLLMAKKPPKEEKKKVKPAPEKAPKEEKKVELKELDQKLDEILG